VGVSKKRMEAEIVRTRSELAALTLVMLLFGGATAAVIARRISKPVQQLAEGAAALARGEWNQRIEPTTDDEIGRLATAFNHMVAELAQQRVDLEDANTELRHGFEQLADLKTYTDNILASLTSGIVTVDLDGRVVTLNPAAELMTGFFVGEVRGRARPRDQESAHRAADLQPAPLAALRESGVPPEVSLRGPARARAHQQHRRAAARAGAPGTADVQAAAAARPARARAGAVRRP